jgi:TRAP-type C4-dicarboxylate transport system permease small subunit
MTESSGSGAVARALEVVHRVEDAALALLLGLMILLAPLQIFLRNFFDAGITWADPMLRVLVLWVGLLGAVAASRGDRHITIDILSKLISERARAAVGFATGLFTAAISAIVAYHAGRFVASEHAYQSVAFSGIQAWIFEIIIPFAFGVIALRYLLGCTSHLGVLLGWRRREE